MEKLFQYAVIVHPTEDGRKAGERSVLLVPPGDWILARNEQEVVMVATRKIPEEHMAHADRIEVAVAPF